MSGVYSDALHVPVLAREIIDRLELKPGMLCVDGTIGAAGHTKQILSLIGETGRVIGIDRDREILEKLKNILDPDELKRVSLVHADYHDIEAVRNKRAFSSVDICLLDLGVSSFQLDSLERGFSFKGNTALDMRMNKDDPISAADVLESMIREDLEEMFFLYGQERFSRRIARSIVKERSMAKIDRADQLAGIIKKAVPPRGYSRIHPATRVFQALRIFVNDELFELFEAIYGWAKVLKPGGKIAVISYHSLEDGLVKRAFKDLSGKGTLEVLTKKPIVPTGSEISRNARSRSAKLRIARRSVA